MPRAASHFITHTALQELDSIPIFATDASKIDPSHPAVAALQQIIQDDLDPIGLYASKDIFAGAMQTGNVDLIYV